MNTVTGESTKIKVEKTGECKCKGLIKNGDECNGKVQHGNFFCEKVHKIFWTYTEEQIKEYLETPRENLKPCKKCKNYRLISKDGIHCINCEIDLTPFCIGTSTNGNPCQLRSEKNSKVCKLYHYDMHEYTDEQIKRITWCPKCKRYRTIEVNEKYCIECIEKKKDTKIYDKKNMCIGRASDETGSDCRYALMEGKKTCYRHQDMENYTKEMADGVKKCPKCPKARPRWRFFEEECCNLCLEKKNINDMEGRCGDNGGLKYDGTKCVNRKVNATNFCSDHSDLILYTDEMLANQKYCTDGNHFRYCGNYNTCEKCRNNRRINRHNICGKKILLEKCLKCNNPKLNGDYCGVHYVDYYKAFAAKQNMKACGNVNRTCRVLLPLDYNRVMCEECSKKDGLYNRKSRW